LAVAGLGTRARVDSAGGDVDVSHQLALAEALWAFRPGRRWQPFVSVGAGAAYVSARGFPPAGTISSTGRSASTWAFVADAGTGVHVALGEHVHLACEVHVEGDAPYPAIRFLGNQLATEGRPTLLGSLSLLVWF
jgi:opacity protein-like surface antigen